MVKKIEGYRSDDGSVHETLEKAVASDLMYAVERVSSGECDLERLTASHMVEFPQDFINVLEQMLPQRVSMDHLQNEVDHLRAQLRLIASMDQSLGGTMPPGDVLKRVQAVAQEALGDGS